MNYRQVRLIEQVFGRLEDFCVFRGDLHPNRGEWKYEYIADPEVAEVDDTDVLLEVELVERKQKVKQVGDPPDARRELDNKESRCRGALEVSLKGVGVNSLWVNLDRGGSTLDLAPVAQSLVGAFREAFEESRSDL